MFNVLLVALGGAAGAVARYLVSGPALKMLGPDWPYGTFAINVAGSFLMGILAGWLAFHGERGMHWRLLLGVGVLGGFTTFSAYSLEIALMIEKKEYIPAAVYSLGSVALGVVGLFAGLWLARRVFG
jgi:CrcB protein